MEKSCGNCRYRKRYKFQKPCSMCTWYKVYANKYSKWKPVSIWQKITDRLRKEIGRRNRHGEV